MDDETKKLKDRVVKLSIEIELLSTDKKKTQELLATLYTMMGSIVVLEMLSEIERDPNFIKRFK